MDSQQVDTLHERASGFYLEGDHRAALEAWLELLRQHPGDERAIEGIRLCEQLVDTTEESVCTPGHSPFAVDASNRHRAAPPGADSPSEMTPLLDELASGGGPPDEAQPGADGAPAGADSFLDFSELEEERVEAAGSGIVSGGPAGAGMGTPPAPETRAEGSADTAGFDFLDLEIEQDGDSSENLDRLFETPDAPTPERPALEKTDPVVASGASAWTWHEDDSSGTMADDAVEAAVLEVRRRVNELLANALLSYENGDKPEALRQVETILQMDEENEPARRLEQRIRQELEHEAASAASQPETEAEPVSSDLDEAGAVEARPAADERPAGFETHHHAPPAEPEVESWEDEEVSLGEAVPLLRPADGESREAALPGGSAAEGVTPSDDDDLDWDSDAAAAIHEPTANSPEAIESPGAGPGRRWILLAIVGLVLGTVLAYQGWQMFGGAQSRADQAAGASGGPSALEEFLSRPDDRASPGNDGARGDPSAATGTPVEPGPPDVASLLAKARRSMDSADYAEAVLLYGQALDLEPTQVDAARELRVAGERFRKQKAVNEQWQTAIAAFDGGDFPEALRILYRLPRELNPARVERLKLAGWFNMGLERLRASDCVKAEANFREAFSIDSEDPGVRYGIRLAKLCGSSPEWMAEVARLRPRPR